MEEAEEKSRGFKVEDKRRFSSEGDLRPEFKESAQGEPPSAASGSSTTDTSAPSAPPDNPRHAERVSDRPKAGAAEPPITFVTFLVGLSTQVLVHLGEIPDPGTGQIQRDLEAAQNIIDLIGIIRDKTRGNLDKDEQPMIDNILFDLRMRYVELAKPSGT